MSILTKICVVILLVLILLACPVFITQATLEPNWRKQWELTHEEAKQNLMCARQYQLLASRLSTELSRARDRIESVTTDKQGRIDELAGLLDAERRKVAAQEARQNQMQVQLTELQASLAKNVEVRKLLQKQLDDSRVEVAKLNVENARLSDVLRDVQGQVIRFEKVARVLREQLVERDERIAELEEKIASMPRGAGAGKGVETVIEGTPPRVEGTVTAVRNNLASISVGSAQGVTQDMKMIVYRGAQFVCHLRIADVDVNQAAGIITDKRLAPMRGDKATNTLK